MKKIIILLVLVVFYLPNFGQEHIVEFTVKNREEIRNLPKYISVDNYKDRKVTAYLWGDNFDKFKTLGYNFTEIYQKKDAKTWTMAITVGEMDSWDRYPTYEVYLQMMQIFETNYPDICKIDTIGTSQNGRLVLAAKISDNVNSLELEPDFFYTATMHGDELAGYVLMLRLIDSLLTSYGTSQQITDIVNSVAIYINPLANPDGTYHGGNDNVSGSFRYLANGQDPNRDFPHQGGTNTPYSIETQDMMNFADEHNFIVSMNFHGGAEVYNFPWDYWYSSENMHADDTWFRHFGAEYVANARVLNSSYLTDITESGIIEGADWYSIDGGRQDYMTYFKHCKEVTMELSTAKMLRSDLLQTYWNYNKQALVDYIATSIQGYYGTVKNSDNNALDAKIETINIDKDNSWAVTNTTTGAYFRPIQPGTYDVTYSATGYKSQTKRIIVLYWDSFVQYNVVLLKNNEIIVNGTAIDAQTGTIIENAKISFINDTVFTKYSDISGNYYDTIYSGLNTIEVFKTGYHPILLSENIVNDTVIDFAMLASTPFNFEQDIDVDFSFSGDGDWTRDNTVAFDSLYSLKSGAITDNQTSTLQLTANTEAGKIFFYKKVSSDSLSDSLKFFIDGTFQKGWTGEDDWSLEGFDISAGNHTFSWTYKKDASGSAGNDCAWIDYIDLPTALPNTYSVSFNIKDGSTANVIEGANVYLLGYGKKISDASGNVSFVDVYETTNTNSINYTITNKGYYDETGDLQILGPTNEVINMQINPNNIVEKASVFKIYPNPAQNFITLETDTDTGSLYIFDLNGKCILSNNIIS
ncbi:MAG: M14 family zinc carboxypeptidase, partial [Bacteroidota bacterium]|nr:M14 family zinc carboxypeptidase [Bacteroidota bacterium]